MPGIFSVVSFGPLWIQVNCGAPWISPELLWVTMLQSSIIIIYCGVWFRPSTYRSNTESYAIQPWFLWRLSSQHFVRLMNKAKKWNDSDSRWAKRYNRKRRSFPESMIHTISYCYMFVVSSEFRFELYSTLFNLFAYTCNISNYMSMAPEIMAPWAWQKQMPLFEKKKNR